MSSPQSKWSEAELIAFEQLVSATGYGNSSRRAYRGDAPEGIVNYWEFRTGGGVNDNAIVGCYGRPLVDAIVEGLFVDREEAMRVGEEVQSLLGSTTNLTKPSLSPLDRLVLDQWAEITQERDENDRILFRLTMSGTMLYDAT